METHSEYLPVVIEGKRFRLVPETSQDAPGSVRNVITLTSKGKGQRTHKRAPRVAYTRLAALWQAEVRSLPPADLRVAKLIGMSEAGTTRAELIKAMRASAHTGRVDGAIRRLRIKGIIEVSEP